MLQGVQKLYKRFKNCKNSRTIHPRQVNLLHKSHRSHLYPSLLLKKPLLNNRLAKNLHHNSQPQHNQGQLKFQKVWRKKTSLIRKIWITTTVPPTLNSWFLAQKLNLTRPYLRVDQLSPAWRSCGWSAWHVSNNLKTRVVVEHCLQKTTQTWLKRRKRKTCKWCNTSRRLVRPKKRKFVLKEHKSFKKSYLKCD